MSVHLVVANNQGPQYRTQDSRALVTRTPRTNGPPIYRNSHMVLAQNIHLLEAQGSYNQAMTVFITQLQPGQLFLRGL